MENSERERLKECFENPPFEYGSTFFWFLNNDLPREDLEHLV